LVFIQGVVIMKIRVCSGVLQAAILSVVVAGGAKASWLDNLATPMSDHELAQLRGGFVGLENLEISIGLEQLVAVDGQTMILNRLTIPNLNQVVDGGRITAQVEQALANAMPTGNAAIVIPTASSNPGSDSTGGGAPASTRPTVGQNPSPGPLASGSGQRPQPQSQPAAQPVAAATGLNVSSAMEAGHWMTVIQNRFNGTVIQNMQQLNIELNNLGAVYRLPQGIRDSMPILP
jgi:hypothetical protein